MFALTGVVQVARILKKDRLPKTDFPSYTLLLMMPFERPGIVSTYNFKPGEPFEAYRALFTARLRQEDVEQDWIYKVTGYDQGFARRAKNDEVYFTPRIVLTSMSKIMPNKLTFDPIAQIMAAGDNFQMCKDWDPHVFVVMTKDSQNE